MSLSNELQNAISAVSVIHTSTSKTAKEFEFGSYHEELNLYETSTLHCLVSHGRHLLPFKDRCAMLHIEVAKKFRKTDIVRCNICVNLSSK
jgi:hypothetical protein